MLNFRLSLKFKTFVSETRSKALEKLHSITAVDIVSGEQLTAEAVADVYQDLPPMKSETFLENVFDLQKFWTKKELKRIFEIPRIMGDIDVMGFDSTLVNFIILTTGANIMNAFQDFVIIEGLSVLKFHYIKFFV